MVWNGSQVPSRVSTDTNSKYEPKVKDKTINHYTSSPINGGLPFIQTIQIVSCRAYKEKDAKSIRDAVFTALNKIKSADGCSYFYCTKQPVIPPLDKTDNYNAQVFVSVRSSK
jgi:hypothetical protein